MARITVIIFALELSNTHNYVKMLILAYSCKHCWLHTQKKHSFSLQ